MGDDNVSRDDQYGELGARYFVEAVLDSAALLRGEGAGEPIRPSLWVILPQALYAVRFSFSYGRTSAMEFHAFIAVESQDGCGWLIGDEGQPLNEWDACDWELRFSPSHISCVNVALSPNGGAPYVASERHWMTAGGSGMVNFVMVGT